jgi:PIN domain nuclease of toxin-antitoxin system
VNLLLDSHTLLWALSAPDKLIPRAREAISDPRHAIYFSAASVWELELKASKRKLVLPAEWLAAATGSGFVEITMTSADAVGAAALPWHHQDPFDRMLVAQARARSLQLATRDPLMATYGVPILPV